MASALKLAALIAASLYACSAQADVRAWPETKTMLAAPDQPPAVYAFVNRAIEEDRLSEAANALERLVRFRPDLTQARFDLVKLYEAMDQGDLADEQRQALVEAGATDTFQADTEITGFFAVGAGYDTNPSATPRDDVLTLRSGDTGLIEEIALGFTREESPLAFVQAGVRVAAPIDARTTAVFDFSGYAAHFFDDNDQDDAIIALRMGPEIVYAKGVFRPFLDLGYRHFGGDPYAVAAALGVEASVGLGPGVLSMELSGGYRDFIPTRDTPGRENLDGTEAQVALSYGVPLGQALRLDVSARVAAVNADKDFEDYFAFGMDAALSATFDAFGRPLVATLGGGVVASRYETPDFQLLDIKRRDTTVAAYFGLAADLDEVTSIDGAVTYRRRFSNYDIFDNEGVRFTIRLARRF